MDLINRVSPEGERMTEAEAAMVLIAYLATRSHREARYEEIWRDLPSFIKLKKGDWDLGKRGEPFWHTPVRNIAAHQKKPGNPIYEGVLKKIPGGFKLV
jgi:hypothetical protein